MGNSTNDALKGTREQMVSNFISFFNTIDHLLCVIDYKGHFIQVNKPGLDLLGYRQEELIGNDANMIFEKKHHKEIAQKYKTIVKEGKGKWTYSLVSKSGISLPSMISFHKGIWDEQEVFFVVGKDISSDMMMEEARNASLRILSSDTGGDKEKIAEISLGETIRLTGSKLGFFGEYDDEKGTLSNAIWISESKVFPLESLPGSMGMQNSKRWKHTIKDQKPIILTNDHISEMGPGARDLSGGMVVPIVVDGSVKYIVGLGNKSTAYSELDVNLISILWDNVITELKRVEALSELNESEFEYKNLFDSSRDGLLLYDLSTGSIVLCNGAAVEMFGYNSHKEILKKTPMDLSAEYQPDGTRSVEALQKNPIRAIHESIYIPMWLHKKKNGDEFFSEVSLTAIYYKGQQIVLANVRDISEKLKVESELKRSEASFNLAIEEGGLGVWDYDVENREMSVGQGFNKIIGHKKLGSVFSADSWLELIHPDDIQSVSEQFRNHIEGKSLDYRNNYRVKKDNGDYIWIQTGGRGIERNEKGVASRMVGIIMDIDSNMKLSKEVEDTRNFLQTIISSIEAILFVKDSEGKYLLANRSFIDKFGLKKKHVIGKTGEELNIPIDIDSNLSDELVIKQGVEQTYEKEVRLRDGKQYDYLITKIPIRDKNENVYAQVGLATDITHIKELEKDLRNNVFSLDAAVNGTGNGLWDWNPKTDDLIVNDNWFGIIGFTRSQFNKKYKKFGFQTFADYVHPEDLAKVSVELEKHYAGVTDYYRTEVRMLTSDNQWKWILASGKVWEWDEDNKPVRMVGIHIDIDYRVRIEEQLKQALVKAEESDKLKSAFLANMSHEIRTPMNGIIGFLDLLDNEEMSIEQRKEYMGIIRNSSNQLLDIVNDIVDISKIEAGQVAIKETSFDIGQLFEDLRMQYRPALDDKNLSFDIKCSLATKEKNIISDQTKLRQVLSNLISNSIKFTAKGGIKVKCERDGSFIKFCVEDSGLGISDDLHKRIFDRFVQAEMGLSRLQEGTGLGLSICKAYVEKLGGKIWLESIMNKGSKFYFTIAHNINMNQIPENDIAESDDEDREGVILVVEDEIYNFLFVEQILQNKGLRVLHAENGQIALDLVARNSDIGMVLMDIRLPGMDGYETTRLLKTQNPGLPIVALTALALSGDREKALEAGCDDYLKKPVLREELLSVVDRMFKK